VSAFAGAVIREQGVTFAVAAVKRSAVNSPRSQDQAIREFSAVFGGLPTVLMTGDSRECRLISAVVT
jgi:hypothetical protein